MARLWFLLCWQWRQQRTCLIWPGMPLPVLEGEIATYCAHLDAGMCRWLELVGELDRRGVWGDYYGCCSRAHWLSWRCAL